MVSPIFLLSDTEIKANLMLFLLAFLFHCGIITLAVMVTVIDIVGGLRYEKPIRRKGYE